MPKCLCGGYGFFWGSEIKGYRGKHYDRLPCLDCNKLSIIIKLWLRLWGYTSNSQINEWRKYNEH